MPQKTAAKSKSKPASKAVKAIKAAAIKAKPLKDKLKTAKVATPVAVKAKAALKAAVPAKAAKPAAKPVAKAAPAPQVEKAKAALKKENSVADALIFAEPSGTVAAAEGKVKKPRAKRLSITAAATEAASALAAKWASLYKKAEQIESKPYNMRGVFEEKTAITHKLMGWGYILANRNDRLEVLFQDGIKYLISNYKN